MLHGSVQKVNETKTAEECVKECAYNCTNTENVTLEEIVNCMKECKCDNLTTENTTQLIMGKFIYLY